MSIEISQIIRCRRRTIALIIQMDGALVVRAPLRVSEKSIRRFAEKNAQWVQRKQAEVRAAQPATARRYLPDELFPFLGREVPLEIVPDQDIPLVLESHFKLAESVREQAEEIFEQWYRDQAARIIPERVRYFAEQNQLTYRKIRIGSARTRWGSCSTRGDLNFSWRLILTPPEVVDYVVVHELAHTLVHNHSARFWKQVERILPNYKTHRKWLRLNGQKVML
jgi:predicted metal-dependent hydrolase